MHAHSQWFALAKQIWPVALGGLVFFLTCDAIDAAVARREAEKQRGLLKPLHLAPMEQPTSARIDGSALWLDVRAQRSIYPSRRSRPPWPSQTTD
eukprot:1156585-Pelagomonas_calceolata.AAC.2